MTKKKKIVLEINDIQYKYLLKTLALGEFVLQGHILETNKQIDQMMSMFYSYAKQFNCEEMVNGPFPLDNDYEINPDIMSKFLEEYFDIGELENEEDVRFMLKPTE